MASLAKLYSRIFFKNSPSQKTPLNEANLNKMDKAINDLDDRVVDVNEQLGVERARIDNIAKLPAGSTTGDAELIDGRTDYKGTTHTNIGAHIREVSSQLSGEIINLLPIAAGNLPKIDWIYGVINKGNIGTSDKRLVTKNILNFPYDLYIHTKVGARVAVYNYDTEKDSGWQYCLKIDANTPFRLVLQYTNDNSPTGTYLKNELLEMLILFNKYTYYKGDTHDYHNSSVKYGFYKFIDAPIVNRGITLSNGNFDNGINGLTTIDLLKLKKNVTIINTYDLNREVKARIIRYNLDGTVSGEEWSTEKRSNRYDVQITDIENYLYRICMWYKNADYVIENEKLFLAYTEDRINDGERDDGERDDIERDDIENRVSVLENKIKHGRSFIDVYAHQGGQNEGYIKNTLENVLACKNAGYEWIECDIRTTLDDVAVCWHDATIKTYDGNETIKIAETNYSDLVSKQFFADPTIKIAKVKDIIDKCKQYGLKVLLDFKAYTDVSFNNLLTYCKTIHMENNIVCHSFSQGPLSKARSILPSVNICYSLSTMPTESIITSDDYKPLRGMLENGKVIVAFNKSLNVSKDYCRDLQAYGFYISIWLVDEDDYMEYVDIADILTTETVTPDMLIK